LYPRPGQLHVEPHGWEESQREEQELAAWQRERQKRETLEQGLEQMVAAQQELESQNRRLRA
jgi:hypothetical protein